MEGFSAFAAQRRSSAWESATKPTSAERDEVADGVERHGGRVSRQLEIDERDDAVDGAETGEEVFSEEIGGVCVDDAEKNDRHARGRLSIARRKSGSVLEEELVRRSGKDRRRGARRRGR